LKIIVRLNCNYTEFSFEMKKEWMRIPEISNWQHFLVKS
jgi:hypothetical protein